MTRGARTARILSIAAAVSLLALAGACATRLGGDGAAPAEGRPCAADRDCPQPSNPCQVWTCWREVCTPVAAAKDTVLPPEAQSAGDCKLLVCDGEGKTSALEDRSDVPPEDENPCAEEVCQDGAPAYPPVAVGTPCGEAGVCNGRGRCGGCLPMEKRCRGNTPETCSEEGEWEDHGPCPAVTPVCGDSVCLGVLEVAAGGGFSCARLGDGQVRCFGDPGRGRLGDGGVRHVAGLGGVIQVAAGARHTCALLADRTVRCWGDNEYGQLGGLPGGARGTAAPVPKLEKVTQLSAGRDFTCARLDDGAAVCWGDNEYGQLGTLPGPRRPAASMAMASGGASRGRPVEVPGLGSTARLALGAEHGCALLQDGTVACWGDDARRQLGRGDPPSPPAKRPKPAPPVRTLFPVKGLKDVVEVAAGGEHACARLGDGAVVCWGRNHRGQLGDGTAKNSTVPVKVKGLEGAAGLALGEAHSCARLADGKVRCWGSGEGHVTGDPSGADRAEPFEVPSLAGVVSLASGQDHVCAGLADRTFLCWGDNEHGQLGSSAPGDRPAPIVW